jgi:hypothetical protein
MSDTITPALTAEEWKRYGCTRGQMDAERFRDLFVGNPTRNLGARFRIRDDEAYGIERDGCHALAALAMYGQSFGFNETDLAWLRTCPPGSIRDGLIARIAALLPPPPP